MTRSSSAYTGAIGSLAAYKGYHGVISAQLNAVLPRTGDTGQVNWNTITTEPNVVRDFEVFAFNDALQATAPIYVRFDYQGGTTANNKITVTVGTSTDGAGTIGGITIPTGNLSSGFSPSGANTRWAYASSDGSYLMLAFNLNPGGAGIDAMCAVVIERTRNADGTANDDGLMCWRWNGTAEVGANTNYFAGTTARIFAGGTQPPTVSDYGAWIPNIANSTSYFIGDTAYAFPVYGWSPLPQGASQALMIGFAADFPRDGEITLNHNGVDMQFLSIGPSAPPTYIPYMSTLTGAATKTTYCPLLRWE